VVGHHKVSASQDAEPGRVEQLTTRVEELEAALAAAHRRSDASLSTVSHDLRGPLTLIIGHADRLLHRSRATRDPSRRIAELESIGMLTHKNGRVLLTARGLMLANDVCARFV